MLDVQEMREEWEREEVIPGMARTLRDRGRRLAVLVGEDYDHAVKRLRPA